VKIMLLRTGVALLFWLTAYAEPANFQPAQTTLNTPVARYRLSADRSLDAFMRLASDFRLPMGIEWTKIVNETQRVDRSWEGATPLEILRDVVKAFPGYEVDTSGEVVHIMPASLHGAEADIVNAHIGPFEVNNDFVRFASSRLRRLVRPMMFPPPPSGGYGGSIATGHGDRRVSFSLTNPTLREALDKLCLAADLKIWIVAYPPQPSKTPLGFFRPIPLDTSEGVNDAIFGPSWVFQEWGRPVTVSD
jgi:hypothetical protein